MMLIRNQNKQTYNNSKGGITLIEIMVGILIVTSVIISGFQAFSSVNIGKIRLMGSVDLEKQIVYFEEKLFEEIKKGGLVDYEEYFNRKVVGTDFSSGHYDKASGFGNFGKDGTVGTDTYGDSFYRCISLDGTKMSGSGCYDNTSNTLGTDVIGEDQRYGQYSLQFIDYNSNYDSDLGDENGDGNIVGDNDDEYLGKGPYAFESGKDIKELYLISGDGKKRTLFRWNVYRDPNAPTGFSCGINGDNQITGSGCIGTIEFLRLEGKDYGLNHNLSIPDNLQYDGVIDTWIIDKDFTGGVEVVAGSDNKDYWIPLFPDDINVIDFQIYLYPNIDYDLAWKSVENNVNLSPYVRLKFTIGPSWSNLIKIKGGSLEFNFSTTISLTDIFSQ